LEPSPIQPKVPGESVEFLKVGVAAKVVPITPPVAAEVVFVEPAFVNDDHRLPQVA
jgi:hypothetical protein